MKLLFLCKRRPQGKDLFERPYGRFYYLPIFLAEKGHDVHLHLLSYKNDPEFGATKENIHWSSTNLLQLNPFAFYKKACKTIEKIKPDWIIGFSDTYYGIMAQHLGAKYNINSLIDAYDNYESYIPWLKPLHAAWWKSLSKASLVTAAGPSLIDLLGKHRPDKPTEIIPMAADPQFKPLGKEECRKKLDLPFDKKLIGYCGSTIDSSRGIETLFEAYNSLKLESENIDLILTGRKGREVSIPMNATWLGYLPDEHMPSLINSLDVLVVMNQSSSFGDYSYPVKLYEAMKCYIPVVVSATRSTKWIMRSNEELLVEPENPLELAVSIKSALEIGRRNYGKQQGWDAIGTRLETLFY